MAKGKKKSTKKVKVEALDREPAKAVTHRCPDCPFKAGLKDDQTICDTCKGTGVVS